MKEFDYFVVVEQTSPEDNKSVILDAKETANGVDYIRFRTCLQSFERLNRNRRMWHTNFTKQALEAEHIKELIATKSMVGESGHPIPAVGQVSMQRIMSIDPNNLSHFMLGFEWEGDRVFSVIETVADINGPGTKLALNVLQGMHPAFSARAVVPQKKNADGTIEVTGPGRFITYDRVILPSHREAYMDKSFPVKHVIAKNEYERVLESILDYTFETSDKVKAVLEGETDIALESAHLDKNGIYSVTTGNKRIYVPVEKKIYRETSSFLRDF